MTYTTSTGSSIPALLVNLTVSQWAARKHDRRITAEVARDHNAPADAGRYHKHLMAKERLAAITEAISELRQWHYGMTLPWLDNGPRVLKENAFIEHTNGFRVRKQKLDALLTDFAANYPDYVEQEKKRLNGMFDPADYPTVAQINRKFGWDCVYTDMPREPDFRITLADEEQARLVAEAQAHAKATFDAAINNAMGDVFRRIADVVGKMSDRLGSYSVDPATGKVQNPFRDSLVENVKELVALLPKLNVTDDPAVETLATEMTAKLASVHPDALRASDKLRESVKQSADEILAKVSAYL